MALAGLDKESSADPERRRGAVRGVGQKRPAEREEADAAVKEEEADAAIAGLWPDKGQGRAAHVGEVARQELFGMEFPFVARRQDEPLEGKDGGTVKENLLAGDMCRGKLLCPSHLFRVLPVLK